MTDDRFKWKVMRTVRLSRGLSLHQRVVLMMLADCAENDGTTTQAWTPSLGLLAKWTGMSTSKVAEVLNELDVEPAKPGGEPGLGWVRRTRPSVEAARSRGEKTVYELLIGSDPEPPAKRKRKPAATDTSLVGSPPGGVVHDTDHPPSPQGGVVHTVDNPDLDNTDTQGYSARWSSPQHGQGVVHGVDMSSPHGGVPVVHGVDTSPSTPALPPHAPAKNTPRADARLRDDTERAERQQARETAPAADESFELAEPPAEKKPKRAAKQKAGESAEFAEFYEAFPRKEDRPAALRAWDKALAKTNPKTGAKYTPAEIMTGLATYVAYHEMHDTRRKYIKQPGPWLNAERWRDEYDLTPPAGYRGPYQDPTPDEDQGEL